MEEIEQLTEKPKSKYTCNINQNGKKNSSDFPIVKNFANIFIGLMLVVLIIVFLSFIPLFYQFCLHNPKLKSFGENKIKMKYLPNIFSEVDTLTKFICISAHIILYLIILSLKSFSDFRNTRLVKSLFDSNSYFKILGIGCNFAAICLLMFSPNWISIILKGI